MIHPHTKRIAVLLLSALLLVVQAGCTRQNPSGADAQKTSFVEDWLLNTYCYIQIPEQGKEDLIREAFALARDYENKLSRTIESSDIGRFNASAQGCLVDADTARLLLDCKNAYDLSEGMLDVSLGAVTSLWDFSALEPEVPEAEAIAQGLLHVGHWDKVFFKTPQAGSGGRWEILKEDPGIMLDLGAVAKGFVADRAADFLQSEGIERAVINFGGNVVFLGTKENGGMWVCGIEDPAAGKSEERIQDRALAGSVQVSPKDGEAISVVTSGTYERCFEQDGVLYHHVLDPRSGYPVETDLLSATVFGASSQMCDALSTSCLLLGSEKGLSLIESQPGYEAIFLLRDDSVVQSSGANFTRLN